MVFEELEQIPWSELLQRPRRPSPWVIAALTVAAGVLIVGFTMTRDPGPSDPIGGGEVVATDSAADMSGLAAPPEAVLSVSEEDLRVANTAEELIALSSAELFLRETVSDVLYIEWAAPAGLTLLESGLWSVQVAMQSIVVDADGTPNRSDVRHVLVPVRVSAGQASLAGPISPTSPPTSAREDAWSLEPVDVNTELESVVLGDVYGWTIVSIEESEVMGELIRVVGRTVEGLDLAVWVSGGRVLDALPVPAQP